MAKNGNLHNALRQKKDEFYTQLSDIEKELKHYKEHFKDKTVFCNCDDPEWSNFWKYFSLNFDKLQIKKLIATHYETEKQSYKLEMYRDASGVHTDIKTLMQNGDFQSPECLELLKEADIVVTNPPFSLFKKYITTLIEYDKKFIIWGNNNAIAYKEVFPLLKDNKIWIGYLANQTCIFRVGYGYKYDEKITNSINDGNKYGKVPSISVFTNLDIKKRHEDLILYKEYNKEEYPHYENYDAIEVNKISNIPIDYEGIMGVPITFINVYNPEQFEIVGLGYGEQAKQIGMGKIGKEFIDTYFAQGNKGGYVENNVLCCYYDNKGKAKIPFARILIKRKK